MPANYARFLIGRQRTVAANRQLGLVLAAVAGAINAGGFLAVQQYTSHVTGMMSAVADHLVLGQPRVVLTGLVGVLAFLGGAVCCAMLVNFARRHRLASEYALPLLLESLLILCFGLLGARLASIEGLLVPATVVLLCFIMGLQNAVVSKLSNAVIRTTHMTGIVTDLGIELGKLAYWNRDPDPDFHVRADRQRLAVLAGILLFVAWNMGEWREFARLKHFLLPYRATLLGTFILTVVFDLTVAVEVGLLMACGFFIYRMSALFSVKPHPTQGADGELPAGVAVFELFGSLFFGAVGKIEALPGQLPASTRCLVLEMHRLISIDTSGIDAMQQLHRTLQRQGVALVLANVNPQPMGLIRRSGFEAELGAEQIVPTVAAAVQAAGQA